MRSVATRPRPTLPLPGIATIAGPSSQRHVRCLASPPPTGLRESVLERYMNNISPGAGPRPRIWWSIENLYAAYKEKCSYTQKINNVWHSVALGDCNCKHLSVSSFAHII